MGNYQSTAIKITIRQLISAIIRHTFRVNKLKDRLEQRASSAIIEVIEGLILDSTEITTFMVHAEERLAS